MPPLQQIDEAICESFFAEPNVQVASRGSLHRDFQFITDAETHLKSQVVFALDKKWMESIH